MPTESQISAMSSPPRVLGRPIPPPNPVTGLARRARRVKPAWPLVASPLRSPRVFAMMRRRGRHRLARGEPPCPVAPKRCCPPTKSSTSRSRSPTTTSSPATPRFARASRARARIGRAPISTAFGARLGAADYLELGALANRYPPEFDTHDRYGRRVDLVRFHPAYHELMRRGDRAGPARLALERAARGRACRARGAVLHADRGRGGARLPDHHDLRRDAVAAPAAGTRARLAAEDPQPRLRSPQHPGRAKRTARRSAWR